MPSARIARDEWASHPHFPGQTLLLGSHENFLAISQFLISRLEESWTAPSERPSRGDDAGAAVALRLLFERWIAAMRSHERYEELKLYPYLEHRFGDSMRCLTVEHQALHDAADAVREAFRGGERQAIAVAMKKHDEVLAEHLRDEEAVVIPLLLELEPHEFDTYCSSPLSALLAVNQS